MLTGNMSSNFRAEQEAITKECKMTSSATTSANNNKTEILTNTRSVPQVMRSQHKAESNLKNLTTAIKHMVDGSIELVRQRILGHYGAHR